MKLYGMPQTRAYRCMWTLAELGLDYEHVLTKPRQETQTEAFLAINPNGRVPAFEDGELKLFESTAICLYLASRYGKPPFWPHDIAEQGRTIQWSVWVMTELDRPMVTLILHRSIFAEEKRIPAKADAAERELERPLKVLDQHLAKRSWLLDGGFSVADVNVNAVFNWQPWAKFNLDPYPHIARWIDDCWKRPQHPAAKSA